MVWLGSSEFLGTVQVGARNCYEIACGLGIHDRNGILIARQW